MNELNTSDFIKIGENTGISAWYRYNSKQAEVYVSGTAKDGFAAWTGYQIGYIPYGHRPPMDVYVKLAGTFYLEILSKDGTIHVKSEKSADAGIFISGHAMFLHN